MMDDAIIEFTCPNCQGHNITEVRTGEILVKQSVDVLYGNNDMLRGQPTISGGYVYGYVCSSCDYEIVNHHYCDSDVLDLVEAIHKLDNPILPPPDKIVDHTELVKRLIESYSAMGGDELAEFWNDCFPNELIRYDGDSMYVKQ